MQARCSREATMAVLILQWRHTIGLSAILATAFIALLLGPAFAQKPALDLMREKQVDPAVEKYRKAVDQEYNATIQKIPEQKKKSNDPWGSLRSAEPAKK
jgi:hypothetical protein